MISLIIYLATTILLCGMLSLISVNGLLNIFGSSEWNVYLVGGLGIAIELVKISLTSGLTFFWQKFNTSYKCLMVIGITLLVCQSSFEVGGFLLSCINKGKLSADQYRIEIDALERELKHIEPIQHGTERKMLEMPSNHVTNRKKLKEDMNYNEKSKRYEQIVSQLKDTKLKLAQARVDSGPLLTLSEYLNIDEMRLSYVIVLLFVFVLEPLSLCMINLTCTAWSDMKDQKQKNIAESCNKEKESNHVPEKVVCSENNNENELNGQKNLRKSNNKCLDKGSPEAEMLLKYVEHFNISIDELVRISGRKVRTVNKWMLDKKRPPFLFVPES